MYDAYNIYAYYNVLSRNGSTEKSRVSLEHALWKRQTSAANRSIIRVHGNHSWTNAKRLFSFLDRRICLFHPRGFNYCIINNLYIYILYLSITFQCQVCVSYYYVFWILSYMYISYFILLFYVNLIVILCKVFK